MGAGVSEVVSHETSMKLSEIFDLKIRHKCSVLWNLLCYDLNEAEFASFRLMNFIILLSSLRYHV